jgi:hypothetical protein
MARKSPCRSCGKRGVRVATVFTAADLDLLKPWARRFDAIRVRRPDHSDAENRSLEAELERDYLACGCRAGRIALAATCVGVVLFAVASGEPVTTWSAERWVLSASFIGLPTLAAKLAGVVRARLRLRARIRCLQGAQASSLAGQLAAPSRSPTS